MKPAPLIYIAGPVSKGWLPENIRNAIAVAEAVAEAGAIPFVPHTMGTLWEFVSPHPHDYWMRICLGVLERCDALIRLPGESSGSDVEVARARELRLPTTTIVNEPGSFEGQSAPVMRIPFVVAIDSIDEGARFQTLEEWVRERVALSPGGVRRLYSYAGAS